MTAEVDMLHRRQTRQAISLEELVMWCMQLFLGFLFVVLIEPAPSDLFFALGFGIFLFTGKLAVARNLHPFFLAFLVFFFANMISALFWKSAAFGAEYMAITVYMLLIPLMMAHFALRYGEEAVDRFYKALFISALISSIIGVLAVLRLTPGPVDWYFRSDDALRLSPLFKDPNVFGPFMTTAATLLIGQSMRASARHKVRGLLLALFMLFVMFLAFSRGAWAGTALSAAIFFVLMALFVRQRRTVVTFSLFSTIGTTIAVLAGIVLLIKLNLADFFTRRFALQYYDDNRFANWANALEVITERPLGVGPGHYVGRTHFPESEFGLATHNIYLKVAVENGWLGFIAFFGAILLLLVQLSHSIMTSDDRQPLRIAIFAAIIGQLFNSFAVDSLHWRHLFVLFGFGCCELVLLQIGARKRSQ
jgi:O-antigen ligase